MKHMFNALLLATLLPVAAHAATYNAVTGFSGTNPSSVWSYGYGTPTSFTAFTTSTTNFQGQAGSNPGVYFRAPGSDLPTVGYKSTGVTFGSVDVPGSELWLHPGPSATDVAGGTSFDAIVVFTAPVTGTYTGTYFFTHRDTGATSGNGTNVGLFQNGAPVPGQSGSLGMAYGDTYTNGGMLSLVAGDKLYFDLSNNGSYYNDSTGFGATITGPNVPGTPEPSSLALLGTGVLSIAGFARRKFQRS